MWHCVISGGVIVCQSARNCFKYYNLWYAARFPWCYWEKISKFNIFHLLPASAVSVSDNSRRLAVGVWQMIGGDCALGARRDPLKMWTKYCSEIYVPYTLDDILSAGEKGRTHRTFPKVRPKCLMEDFTNLYGIYKAHQTNVWWTMQVFRLHCILDEGSKFQNRMFISFPQFIYCSCDEVYFPKLSCLIAAHDGTLHSKWAPYNGCDHIHDVTKPLVTLLLHCDVTWSVVA